MVLRKWDDLPDFMKTEEVKPYYEVLRKKRFSLVLKRAMDLVGGVVLLVLLVDFKKCFLTLVNYVTQCEHTSHCYKCRR